MIPLRKTCILLALALTLIGVSPCPSLAEELKKEYKEQYYVFINGSIIHRDQNERESKIYDGVKFPLYCGYLIVTNNNIKFVKKTPLPITGVVEFFEQVEKDKFVVPYKSPEESYKPADHDPVPIGSPRFREELFNMMLFKDISMTVPFIGQPDENYTPQLEETCTFNSSTQPEEFCFSTKNIYDILIPTSNEEDFCRGYREFSGKEYCVSYNRETKKWDSRSYYDEKGAEYIIELLDPKTKQWDIRYRSQNNIKTYERFNPKTKTWQSMPALPTKERP